MSQFVRDHVAESRGDVRTRYHPQGHDAIVEDVGAVGRRGGLSHYRVHNAFLGRFARHDTARDEDDGIRRDYHVTVGGLAVYPFQPDRNSAKHIRRAPFCHAHDIRGNVRNVVDANKHGDSFGVLRLSCGGAALSREGHENDQACRKRSLM
jgi:hypothetical protein